jgi:transcriptional repressor NrdR
MICPSCNTDGDKVIDSRPAADGLAIRRRRECLACGNRFTTYEQLEIPGPTVTKNDGRKEPFDTNKIATSLKISLDKRPVSKERIQAVVTDLSIRIKNEFHEGITTQNISELVLNELLKLDEVGYVRYAADHKQYADKDEFTTFLKALPRSLQVVKSNGSYEPFKREKLLKSLNIALRKRPVSQRRIENAIDEIINELAERNEVSSSELGNLLMIRLKAIDEVAYIRYASVYRKFQDAAEFAKEVESLTVEEKVDEQE